MTDFLSNQLDALHQINLDIGKILGPLQSAALRLRLEVDVSAADIPSAEVLTEAEAQRLCDAAITRAQLARDIALKIRDFLDELPKGTLFPDEKEGGAE